MSPSTLAPTRPHRTVTRDLAPFPVETRSWASQLSTRHGIRSLTPPILMVGLIALSFSLASCRREPRDFNDCVLEHVKSGMSDEAVLLVTQACRDKFPERTEAEQPEPPLVDLPAEATSLLTGRFGHRFGNTWSGTLHNGTADWVVEEIVIFLHRPGWPKQRSGSKKGEPSLEVYRVSVSASPLATSTFSVVVNWPEDAAFGWFIFSARGRHLT